MSTDLLQGALPGAGKHTYWMPPLYFIYLATIFRLAGPNLVSLRVASFVPALVVMVLTYLLGLRIGLGRYASLLPVALLALDAVFLRGALVGRMDMVALSLVLLALWSATRPISSIAKPGQCLLLGAISASPALVHPLGAAATAAIFVFLVQFSRTRHLRCVLPFLLGTLAVFVPWVVYILRDPRIFILQFGAQFVRKSARHTSLQSILSSFVMLSQQYAIHRGRLIEVIWAPPLLLLGCIGLVVWGKRSNATELQRQTCFLLFLCESLATMLALWAGEMWYLVYLIPLAAIGLVLVLKELVQRWPSDREGVGVILLFLCLWTSGYVLSNVRHVSDVKGQQNPGLESDYASFSLQISKKIPLNSRILLATIPDPYFVLKDRADLVLREFVPDGFPIPHDQYRAYMSEADYIVVGQQDSFATSVQDFIHSRGTLVGTIGRAEGGYFTRIYRINSPENVPVGKPQEGSLGERQNLTSLASPLPQRTTRTSAPLGGPK